MVSERKLRDALKTKNQLLDKRVKFVDPNVFVPNGLFKSEMKQSDIKRYLDEIERIEKYASNN